MASKILSNAILVNLEIQSGDGIPEHLNKVGYLYVNRDNGDYYVGKGGVTWDLLSSGGGGTGNTFVNSFVYNNANKFTITRNDAVSLDASFNSVTGLTINGDLTITGITSAATLNITTTPTNNNSLTEILGRNSSTGEIEYRDVSTIGGGGGSLNVTVVTGATYSATSSDNVIGVDTSLIPVTIYLPDSVSTGIVRYEVKDIGVNSYQNPITIQANISDTIITTDLVSSFDLSADGGAVILVSTGSGQWWQM